MIHGLIYNEKENRLYYDGELVRYFEDIVSTDYYLKWPNENGTVDAIEVGENMKIVCRRFSDEGMIPEEISGTMLKRKGWQKKSGRSFPIGV